MRRFLLRLLNVFRRKTAEMDLAREIAAHLALLEDDFRRRGMSAGEARLAARRAMGSVEHTKDLHRDARSLVWLDDARRDIVHAARLLRRNPLMTITAALSLAVGIGANTAIFTVANALLLRSAGGRGRSRSPRGHIGIGRIDSGFNPGSYPTYLDIRRRATPLGGVYAHPMFPHAMSLGAAGGLRRGARRWWPLRDDAPLHGAGRHAGSLGAGCSARRQRRAKGASPVVAR